MKREQMPIYVLAVALLVVGLAVYGVPLGNLAFLLLALACPLMMIFMMGGMHGGHGDGHGRQDESADRINGHDQQASHHPAAGDQGEVYR